MQIKGDCLIVSPSDLSAFLACSRKTALDLGVALKQLTKPSWQSPLAGILIKRGQEHEGAYVERLRAEGLSVINLTGKDDPEAAERAMRSGTDVIVQAPLGRDGWFGLADILRRVDVPSALGGWSYEVEDTKLTRETKAGTILQLCAYSEFVSVIQGMMPERFHVVTPVQRESYRLGDFAAYYRLSTKRLGEALGNAIGVAPPDWNQPSDTPASVAHCEFCRWWERCNGERRAADHLSFVAGMGRLNEKELESRTIATMAALGDEVRPLTWLPERGAKATYERLGHQAHLQVKRRKSGTPQMDVLQTVPGEGLGRLPEASEGDLFLDLEGDPFGRRGGGVGPGDGTREYLFGLGQLVNGQWISGHRWAWSDVEEKAGFEWAMARISTVLESQPAAHVYHYGSYEQSSFKRLASRHATCESELDVLLRGGRLVDLYSIARQSVRCGVESYSIKELEEFYGFVRNVDLRDAGTNRQLIEVALESGDTTAITTAVKAIVVGYNEDDCRSTSECRIWLERIRQDLISGGQDIPRPTLKQSEESKATEADRKAAALRQKLLTGVPDERVDRSPSEQARWLMAFLIEWHRREERVAWGEYHRLREKPVEELEQEASALVGLQWVERVQTPGGKIKTATDRYRFDAQPVELKEGDQLKLPDDSTVGKVASIDRDGLTIDIKKTKETNDFHPSVVIELSIVSGQAMKDSLFREGERIAALGIDDISGDRIVNDLLLRRPPRLKSGVFQSPATDVTEALARMSLELDGGVLPVQGPPGSGKTFTGARMIRELVKQGKKVGVVANSHKVIANLIEDVLVQATEAGDVIRAGQKCDEDDALAPGAVRFKDAKQVAGKLDAAEVDVVGGTAWLWADEKFRKSVDVLFVDEAGQMSLANVIAVAPAARDMVLLGDPQQLAQPKKGSHPDGCDVSALDHLLAGAAVVSSERGALLPVTWRMAPQITEFTSRAFYAGKLGSRPGLEKQALVGTGVFEGAGLWFVPVEHEGNQNFSIEEVDTVTAVVERLLAGGQWTDADGETKPLTAADILVVTPYNAQVTRLSERFEGKGIAIGTVDKFQGQEAPVAIYSMAASTVEDAPKGMEFLFSPNRLNVATSRARCAAIIVASPRLLGPDCKSPRQMHLANGLCEFVEMAQKATCQ